MLNIHELERRWFKYQLKKRAPLALSIVSILIIVPLYLIWPKETTIVTEPKIELTKILDQNITPTKPVAITKTVPPAKPLIIQIEPKKVVSKKLMLKPSFGFMYDIEDDILDSSTRTVPMDNYTAKSQYKEQEDKKQVSSYSLGAPALSTTSEIKDKPVPIEIKSNRALEKEKTFHIKTQTGTKELQDIINRFKKNKKPALSLFIARKYYSLGEYEKSYNYALITNQLNRDIEESWLIFSKSLIKLNQKEMAIKTLNKYISQSNSIAATTLLNEINTGNFK